MDSELLDDRTKVLGVLAADNDGLCLMGNCNFIFIKGGINHYIKCGPHVLKKNKINLIIFILAKGEIDKGLVSLATALSSIAANLEEDAEELPTIVIDTEET